MKKVKRQKKGAVVLLIVLLGLSIAVWGCKKKESTEEGAENRTVYDMFKEDDARLRAEPVIKQQAEDAEQQTEQQAEQEKEPVFKELSEIEEVEAERLFEMAIQFRKMGRLPGVSYKQSVDACRQLIEKFPGSEYEFKAKRILAEIPEQERKKYKITDEEIDLGNLQ